jgi:sugar phosphate isomerase/epimerase
MKLAIALTTPKEAFETSQGWRLLKKKFAIVSGLGYDGIELMIEDPSVVNSEKLRKLAQFYELLIPAVGTGIAYLQCGLSFAHPDRRERSAAIKRVKDYMLLASDLDTLVIIGLIRGKIGVDTSYKKAWSLVRNCLRECSATAKDLGVLMALEPINRYETAIINTVDEALKMIEEVRSDYVRIMVDTFHMNLEEASITEALRKARKLLVHVHVADSNRKAPGMGHLNFHEIINVLNEIRYTEFLSAEILPKPNFGQAARKTIDYLKKLL